MAANKIECEIKISCDTKDELDVVYKMLKPEASTGARADVRIEKVKNVVVVRISAKDPVVARSVMNSYLRILSAVEGAEKEGKEDADED